MDTITRGVTFEDYREGYDMNQADYNAVIQKEAEYWGKEKESAISSSSIPWNVDLRLCTDIYRKPRIWWDDLRINNVVHGKIFPKIIQTAVNKGGKCLDLGCGGGWLSLELARYGLDVTGVDISAKSLEIARNQAQKNPFTETFGSLNYVCADLNKIELPDQTYDIVTGTGFLHHTMNLERLLIEIKKTLKEDMGIVIIYDNIGYNTITMTLSKLINLPSRITGVIRKPSKLVDRLFKKDEDNINSRHKNESGLSPFEHASEGSEVVEIIKKYFPKVTYFRWYHSFCKAIVWKVGALQRGRNIGYIILKLFKMLDDLICRIGCRGTNFLLIAENSKKGEE